MGLKEILAGITVAGALAITGTCAQPTNNNNNNNLDLTTPTIVQQHEQPTSTPTNTPTATATPKPEPEPEPTNTPTVKELQKKIDELKSQLTPTPFQLKDLPNYIRDDPVYRDLDHNKIQLNPDYEVNIIGDQTTVCDLTPNQIKEKLNEELKFVTYIGDVSVFPNSCSESETFDDIINHLNKNYELFNKNTDENLDKILHRDLYYFQLRELKQNGLYEGTVYHSQIFFYHHDTENNKAFSAVIRPPPDEFAKGNELVIQSYEKFNENLHGFFRELYNLDESNKEKSFKVEMNNFLVFGYFLGNNDYFLELELKKISDF